MSFVTYNEAGMAYVRDNGQIIPVPLPKPAGVYLLTHQKADLPQNVHLTRHLSAIIMEHIPDSVDTDLFDYTRIEHKIDQNITMDVIVADGQIWDLHVDDPDEFYCGVRIYNS